MKRTAAQLEADDRHRANFEKLNEAGAHDYRLLWLKVNEEAVRAFTRHGFGDELQRRGAMASALAESLYKALLHAEHAFKKEASDAR